MQTPALSPMGFGHFSARLMHSAAAWFGVMSLGLEKAVRDTKHDENNTTAGSRIMRRALPPIASLFK